MNNVIPFPIPKASNEYDFFMIKTWELILQGTTKQHRKRAIMTAYLAGLLDAKTTSYFMKKWKLGKV